MLELRRRRCVVRPPVLPARPAATTRVGGVGAGPVAARERRILRNSAVAGTITAAAAATAAASRAVGTVGTAAVTRTRTRTVTPTPTPTRICGCGFEAAVPGKQPLDMLRTVGDRTLDLLQNVCG